MAETNEFKIIVDLDVYYKLINGSHIVAERINGLDNLMILLRGKIEGVYK
jgi:hypothetical protein